jgi:hypothetical protein
MASCTGTCSPEVDPARIVCYDCATMKTATIAAWLLTEALKLPHSAAPGETPEAYRERMGTVSASLATTATTYADGRGWTATELAAAMLVLWHEETLFDQRIHAGLPHPKWTQDDGKATCNGQIHRSMLVPPEVWSTLSGTDEPATTRCARATAIVMVAQARQCGAWLGQRASRGAVARTMMGYGSGGTCAPDDRAWARADKWLSLMKNRPDRSPVKGFRRAVPGEIPAAVREAADRVRSDIGKDAVIGKVYPAEAGGQKYALVVERHAEGKTGISVLVAE